MTSAVFFSWSTSVIVLSVWSPVLPTVSMGSGLLSSGEAAWDSSQFPPDSQFVTVYCPSGLTPTTHPL